MRHDRTVPKLECLILGTAALQSLVHYMAFANHSRYLRSHVSTRGGVVAPQQRMTLDDHSTYVDAMQPNLCIRCICQAHLRSRRRQSNMRDDKGVCLLRRHEQESNALENWVEVQVMGAFFRCQYIVRVIEETGREHNSTNKTRNKTRTFYLLRCRMYLCRVSMSLSGGTVVASPGK